MRDKTAEQIQTEREAWEWSMAFLTKKREPEELDEEQQIIEDETRAYRRNA